MIRLTCCCKARFFGGDKRRSAGPPDCGCTAGKCAGIEDHVLSGFEQSRLAIGGVAEWQPYRVRFGVGG